MNRSGVPFGIPFGVLGLGRMGLIHCQMVTATEGLRLVAGSSRSAARRAEAERAFSIRAYESHQALLADPQVAWVIIATYTDQHYHWALRATEAGKSLLIEKPIALSLSQAAAIFRAAARRRVRVTVHQNRRWDRDFLLVRELIEQGELGGVYRIESRYTGFSGGWAGWGAEGLDNPWRLRRQAGGGRAGAGRRLPGRTRRAIIRPVTSPVPFPRRPFLAALSPEERELVGRLDEPERIQEFLSGEIAYNFEPDGETAWGPLSVLHRRLAHCFEGAIFAAALLWYHGWQPLLVLLEAPRDFDHNLVVYSRQGLIGSVSQSRHPELRGKAARFTGIRELVLSYYPDYTSDWTHDPEELTLRGFSEPIDLRRFGAGWVTAAELWPLYRSYLAGVRLERLFPSGEADRFYFYPPEHLAE